MCSTCRLFHVLERKSDTRITDFYKLPKPIPLSSANAFYSFDNHVLDLHGVRDGAIIGGSVSYDVGYIGYGKSIVFNQSVIPTCLSVTPGFVLSVNSNFTIEGFFMLYRLKMNATLVQLTPWVALKIVDGFLSVSLSSDRVLTGPQNLSNRDWHHFGLVYNGAEQSVKLFIDGSLELSSFAVPLQISLMDLNATMIIGADYQGRIDQLAISLRVKPDEEIVWDATAMTYHSFDNAVTFDKGPHGQNATLINPTFVSGWRGDALNFNASNSSYRIDHLSALSIPLQSFSIALWLRAESEPGIFLTVSSPSICLLVLGIAADDNALIAYLPNATAGGQAVRIHGPSLPPFHWTHISFTWSVDNRARLYGTIYLHPGGSEANTLNNARTHDQHREPMSVILGEFDETGPCRGIQEDSVNTMKQFKGSLDELYVFTRELDKDDLIALQKV